MKLQISTIKEECKNIGRKVIRHIIEDIESSSDESDEE